MEAVNSKKGFTLIEVLVATAILALAILATLTTMNHLNKYETINLSRIKAIQLAYACSEYIQSLDYYDISSNSCSTIVENNVFRNINLEYKIDISQEEIIADRVKLIDILVRWEIYGKERNLSIRVIKKNEV